MTSLSIHSPSSRSQTRTLQGGVRENQFPAVGEAPYNAYVYNDTCYAPCGSGLVPGMGPCSDPSSRRCCSDGRTSRIPDAHGAGGQAYCTCPDMYCAPVASGAEDSDGDGLVDSHDPCPDDPLNDADKDGVCDSDDKCPGFSDEADRDGDGWPNMCDNCEFIGNEAQYDRDGDSEGDACDPCPDDRQNACAMAVALGQANLNDEVSAAAVASDTEGAGNPALVLAAGAVFGTLVLCVLMVHVQRQLSDARRESDGKARRHRRHDNPSNTARV